MSLSALGSLLESVPQYRRLRESLNGPRVDLKVHLSDEATSFTLATLWQDLKTPMLVVVPRPDDARRLHEQLVIWSGDENSVLHFPEIDILPFERLTSDVDTIHQRLCTLFAMKESNRRSPIVVTSAGALTQKTVDRDTFISSIHSLHSGQHIDSEKLLEQWRHVGYDFQPTVYAPGIASRRGGILDIYSVDWSLPARIEFLGNDIDSIRLFDPDTQLSEGVVDSIKIIPARETLPDLTSRVHLDSLMDLVDFSNCSESAEGRMREELELLLDGQTVEDLSFYSGFFNRGCLMDYFREDGLLVMFHSSEIQASVWNAEKRTRELRKIKEKRGELPIHFPSPNLSWSEVTKKFTGISNHLSVMRWSPDDLISENRHTLPFLSVPNFLGKLEDFVEHVDELVQEGHRVVAVTSHSTRLGEILADHGVASNHSSSLVQTPVAGTLTIFQAQGARIDEGFVLIVDQQRLVVFSDSELFGSIKGGRNSRRASAIREAFLSNLSPGDYVVHVEHGIGKFEGAEHMPEDKNDTEYLIIRYAKGDKLYVPMEHLDRVTAYLAPKEYGPNLTRLGTQEWKRAKERAVRSTREMANELLSLYAARELVRGHAFGSDVRWQTELEESFPYEETSDQKTTIAEVKADMEDDKPMDRLVCGDVGYGKTEIALRAAFKAVMDGQQVAVLVPTTVLAQQHYETFVQRLGAFPITIRVLSRLRTGREQSEILEGLANGGVDICIGTHRLIQKDIRFKNLGLVIVDEEQRFGVAHKERFKRLRSEVDVLTMTATPIPRTLHMSMAGVRDMSMIETPPEERLPIKTYVSEVSDELIREAILRELDRQGQIYFLHNRVHNIEYMAKYIHTLVPEAKVGIAHGQMPESQLEKTMIAFAEGEIEVLVCTTIIESGLDIPNANTLIVNRSETFGLSQLYQLRGRVGRSERRAYSYFLVPKTHRLTEAAQRRLRAMLEATELGAGFRIAMKDLEIRGAGNILGAEQSGHIDAVGFELYTRMLAIAVEELRAHKALDSSSECEEQRKLAEVVDPALLNDSVVTVDLSIPASIPPEYITDLTTRLGVYKKLVEIDESGRIEEIKSEMRDRFGPVPLQVQNLLYVMRLKIQSRGAGIKSITMENRRIVLRLHNEVGGARPALQRALGRGVEVGNTQILMKCGKLEHKWEKLLVDIVDKLSEFMERVDTNVQSVNME